MEVAVIVPCDHPFGWKAPVTFGRGFLLRLWRNAPSVGVQK
jgi:hypothetical protein